MRRLLREAEGSFVLDSCNVCNVVPDARSLVVSESSTSLVPQCHVGVSVMFPGVRATIYYRPTTKASVLMFPKKEGRRRLWLLAM